MANFQLNSQVVLFRHSEYGARLLFKNGLTNPRDELGKNGVNIHHWFTSWFYRVIPIEATVINEFNKIERRIFYVNRNSLIKYLGADINTADSNGTLVAALKTKLWQRDSNSSEDAQQKEQQVRHGAKGLRHAGRHNKGLMNGFFARVVDYLKASFLGWLYQKTIVGMNRIKVRFLLVGSEKISLKQESY